LNKPTFFYAECVLSYIDADKVDELLKYIRTEFKLAYLFDYEMYDPNDRFGQMMVKNFNLMGCPLVGIYKYPNLKDQKARF
jgi:O-methyltransferase involved in polyketide biosynthesis